jgi:hypothetical protein
VPSRDNKENINQMFEMVKYYPFCQSEVANFINPKKFAPPPLYEEPLSKPEIS